MNSDNPDIDVDLVVVEAFSRYFANEELAINKVLNLIIGEIPNWVPKPSISSANRSIQYLFNLGLSEKDIAQYVKEARSDELSYPGEIIDSAAFTMQVYELAKLADSVALGDRAGLMSLAGADAVRGKKILESARAGHEAVHGTKREKEERKVKIIAECRLVGKLNKTWGLTTIRTQVAENLKISAKTVQRATPHLKDLLGRR